jgi:hypothetical protein
MLRPDAASFFQNYLSYLNVLSLSANVVGGLLTSVSNSILADIFGVLNHNDTVGSLRDSSAGHNLGALVWPDCSCGWDAGLDGLDNRKSIGKVRPTAGVTIHHCFIKRRHIYI